MRKKTPKIYIKPKYILFFLMTVCVISIAVSFKYSEKIAPVKTKVGDVFTPMQKGINLVGRWAYNKYELITRMNELEKENEELKNELEQLKGENRLLASEKYELKDLRAMYELTKTYSDYPTVGARIITKNPNNFYSTFTIDKGSNDGIKKDMNVICGDGLVGLVSEVGHNYSVVRTIIDDKSNVTGMFRENTVTCNVAGDLTLTDKGYLKVTGILKEADVNEGDPVTTAYGSPKFHPGIIIGYVTDIHNDSNNMTKSAYLVPVVDFTRLDMVLIITELSEGLY